ncbi:MAG: 50S ribosomal protein L6 [bacterium]|nr:50S ribosomal protein L6 [bacterium]
MSRIGKQPLTIPQGTEVTVADGIVAVKGKGGELRKRLHPDVSVTIAGDNVETKPVADTHEARMLWGTFASHIRNMITGVNEPFEKRLVVEGVGYRVNQEGNTLVFDVGFSHQVRVAVPDGIEVSVEKNEITIKGINKELVGQFAANVRAVKKPEPYKGKGIRYADEVIRRKEGKRAVA